MSDLNQQFEQAQKDVVSLAERPENSVLLKLYAYYKQAVDGDVSGDKPGMFDLVAKKKYAAWEELKGTSSDEAKQLYIAEVERLLNEE
ncbi:MULTISPECIES: acyl-CoA-binding protein [Vitreoscilla]|uniref:Acyl-CoA-binding protein n=1 Tax=Vitreoscilla stercoraria TaxID=61 RepID=A0ABY4ED11_VITST|nr:MULTISPECIES: acyl-CoA-binding protein [Vitreoscilla]AUZ05465.2 acyl-CoA-binding protein [Vitreoscilla sp. C1]UOO93238.1 acyl-CoA-binding protein [Vitreoscilla stercoraria]